ncbi:MAG TPA: DEAD/DEAH box helicase [Candidatus Ornithoclostridium excrementipullorum]|nr:DEAD/DEAH box helicase [Candidatus Ornithoclostridium excrementipullorum]
MFNPVKASKNIKEEFINYVETSFSFAEESLREQFVRELDKIVAAGPYLEVNDVFQSGKSIEQLIEEGVLSPLFRRLEEKKELSSKNKKSLPIERPLYLHQEKAIRTLVCGKNAVVSTGTGSGKTNCFLIPVINELLREQEHGTLNDGIRALFIYPMNALANDQIKNIRKLLMEYPDITFGVYNGATEEDEEKALTVYEAMFAREEVEKLRTKLSNEKLSRAEMKKNPPHILFTNYAMLEHLLFRPNDDVLFTNSDFRFVVLDEAHVYAGATGIETALLLRRLKARITSKQGTQFILTSATLGTDNDSDDDIIQFARNLCGEEFTKDVIIRGTREKFIPTHNKNEYPKELICDLANEENDVASVLSEYGVANDASKSEPELLYDFILTTALYQRLRSNQKKVMSLEQIQQILSVDMDTTIAFISICTRAQKNGKALVDARYHFFIRSLEGCFITLNKDKKMFLTRQKSYLENGSDYAVFEVALCDECGRYAIIGRREDNQLKQANKFNDVLEYFFLASEENDDIEGDPLQSEQDESKPNNERYYLCTQCGAIIPKEKIKNPPCDCGMSKYIEVIKVPSSNIGAKCGNCHIGTYKRFYLGNDAATAVLATSLYEELPESSFEDDSAQETKTNFLLKITKERKKKAKKTGRQFLAFSDSRQEAAKFACYLGKSYQEFLRRRGIYQIIKQHGNSIIEDVFTISDFVAKLTSFFSNRRTFAESNNDNGNLTAVSNENAWVAMLNELVRFNSATSMTRLGILQFHYLGNTEELIDVIAKEYNVDRESVANLLDLLVFEIVKNGAVLTNSDTDINDNDREYIFYTPSQRFITKIQNPEKRQSTIFEWSPKHVKGKADKFVKTNRLYYVKRFLKLDDIQAAEFLDMYFDYLVENEEYPLMDVNKDKTYAVSAKFFQVKISGDKSAKWYRCKKCGRVSQFNLNGHCVTPRCDGEVVCVNPEALNKENHFAQLYCSDRMSPLFIKEHTAQLSKKESLTYQEQFIKKEINALSCSTTFEMGVDVGDLETVFLRNVPPLPSNYAQRAGRAGRSVNAAAYALTFAKLSSHDLTFFKEPEKMINGSILPPLFKVDNDKIVKRHIYAVALSMFFEGHAELYNHNQADKFINEKGYLQFIEWLNSKPEKLKNMLLRSIPDINNLHDRMGIEDFGWLNDFIGSEGTFTALIREYEGNLVQFDKIIKQYDKEKMRDLAAKCERKKYFYMKNKLIDFLARGNILPRYGFPVDTVELEQNTTAKNIDSLRLSRDLQVAIAEYAPSSEVVADGKLYTSRYIKKSNVGTNKEWYTGYIGVCPNEDCKAVNYSVTPIATEGISCSSCGQILHKIDFVESIEPRSGFVTERETKEVPLSKQEKNYKSEDYYIGNKGARTIDKFEFKFNGIKILVESTTNDSLLVKSSNSFYVCPVCGFAYASDETISEDKEANRKIKNGAHVIKTVVKHESLFSQSQCNCQELKKYTLHHIFNTDVAKINFQCDTSDYDTMVSTMYAILNAMADTLNIERRDIKACLSPKLLGNELSYSIIIYDSVPGGAGHSRRLVTSNGKMLYQIFMAALKRVATCKCTPSCYSCLRSYDNQKIHDNLDRKKAEKFLQQFMGEIEVLNDQTT